MGSSLSMWLGGSIPSLWTAEGKNVFITGASGGIGAELARNFAKEGASLCLLARIHDSLLSVAKECTELGSPKVEIVTCDLTNDEEIKASIDSAVEKFGNFDVLVLNAGRSMGCYFEEIKDVDSINYMFKINVSGVINTLYHLLPSVPKSSASRIIFISSIAGLIPVPYRTIYCATKHALAGFANSLRIELQDTYGKDAPTIQLINFPEVAGTALNTGRMTFGADLPPVQFSTTSTTGSRVPGVQETCRSLMKEIIRGAREWGQPMKLNILLPLRGILANTIDSIILKTVKKTHFRPTVE